MYKFSKKKSRLTLFIISLLFTPLSLSFASNSNFDASKSQLVLENADTIKSSNPKKFVKLLALIEENIAQLPQEQLFYFNYLDAYRKTYSGEFEKSISLYQGIINSNASFLLKFRANLSIVNSYAISNKWIESLLHLSKNFEMIDNVQNPVYKQQGILAASMLYNLLGQYELGLRYAQELLNKSEEKRNICLAHYLSLQAKLELELLNDNTLIEQGLTSCQEANEMIMSSFIISYHASLLIKQEQLPKALEILKTNLNNAERTNYPPLIVQYYSLLEEIYIIENKTEQSKTFAMKVISKAKGLGNVKPLVQAYFTLYQDSLKSKEDFEALNYYIKYSDAKSAHLEGKKAKHLAFQLAQHQSFEQESQIKLLNEKNALLLSKQALAKAKVANVQLFITILTVTITLLMLWGGRLWKSHKRVKELAEYDALTGIYNRGHFTQVTNSALKHCKNAQQELSLIMFDLDHFKKVNDSFGHACGDWALKETITVCKNIGRKNDIFARLGGEEFCLVLPSCSIDVAMLRAEACRAAIEEIITEESGCEFSITASFGVTDVKRSGFDLDKLLADADFAAYASKNNGRNRVTLFEVPANEAEEKLDSSWGYN